MKKQPPPIEEELAGGKRRRKNTRRWCKGRKGVEHQFEDKAIWMVEHFICYVPACTKCGKRKWSGARFTQ